MLSQPNKIIFLMFIFLIYMLFHFTFILYLKCFYLSIKLEETRYRVLHCLLFHWHLNFNRCFFLHKYYIHTHTSI